MDFVILVWISNLNCPYIPTHNKWNINIINSSQWSEYIVVQKHSSSHTFTFFYMLFYNWGIYVCTSVRTFIRPSVRTSIRHRRSSFRYRQTYILLLIYLGLEDSWREACSGPIGYNSLKKCGDYIFQGIFLFWN